MVGGREWVGRDLDSACLEQSGGRGAEAEKEAGKSPRAILGGPGVPDPNAFGLDLGLPDLANQSTGCL